MIRFITVIIFITGKTFHLYNIKICVVIQKGRHTGLPTIQNTLKRATGLPTKDETSETTVQNVYCLFSDIQDSLQL